MKNYDTLKTVFLAEDHPIFRKGLTQIINRDKRFSVIGEAEDHLPGIKLIKELKPDIVLVDIGLKESCGLDLIKDIKQYHGDAYILAVSMHDENVYAEKVLRLGAHGYLMKLDAPEMLIDAMCHILDRNIYLSEKMSSLILKDKVHES